MDYCCDVCDKTSEIISKSRHLQSLTHNEVEKWIRKNHIINSPTFFDKDEIFNEYSTNHNKNIDSALVKNDFKLIFDKEISPPIKSVLQNYQTEFHLKKGLLLWIEYFSERGYKFSQISEMCLATVRSIRYMTYKMYFEKPMRTVELKLIMILHDNPYLINVLERKIFYPSISKYSYII